MIDRLDDQLTELIRRVADATGVPDPAAVRRRARRRRRRRAGGVAAVLAMLVAGLLVGDRLAAPTSAPAGPVAPLPTPTSTAPATTKGTTGPAGPLHGKVIASGTRGGEPWRLTARVQGGQDCYDLQTDASSVRIGEGTVDCRGHDEVLIWQDVGSPNDTPPSPFGMAAGVVSRRAALVRLTLKRWPRDTHSKPVQVLQLRPIDAGPGFTHRFFVAVYATDLWPAEALAVDAKGRKVCRRLGDDFKTPVLDTFHCL